MSWMRQRSAAIWHMLTIFAISFISKVMYNYIECRCILHGIFIFKVSLILKCTVNIVFLLKSVVSCVVGYSVFLNQLKLRMGVCLDGARGA